MGIARVQVSVPFAPALPENVISNTVYFRDSLPNEWPGSTDWDAIAADVAEAFETSWYGGVSLKPITAKVYNAQAAPPNFPLATHVRNPAASLQTPGTASQLAICLSFKGGPLPRQRGRIYLAPWLTDAYRNTAPELRPSAAQQNWALGLADALADVGGVDIDWGVWSRIGSSFTPVSQSWVDDSWDIQRRRKLDPTSRLTHSHSE